MSRSVPWKFILVALGVYLAVALLGGLFLLTSYFDETHPPPLTTPKFLFVMLVLGPLAILAFGFMEAMVESLILFFGKAVRLVSRRWKGVDR
jgi:asparagine N-glycosylation enzyme membrane subunit Stt3